MGGSLSKSSSPSTPLQSSKQDQGPIPNESGADDSKPKKKICCACPETKKARDECIVENGEDACQKLIDAHRRCLRAEGFNV